MGIAVSSQGDLYIADTLNNRIRRVSSSGIITTIAGNGSDALWSRWMGDYAGDGGPASGAVLSLPSAVALDSAGNLYIADAGNHRIREVYADGRIATVAGSGLATFSGDGGLAVAAGLNWPSGIAVDGSGNLFVADSGNYRVRKVSGGFISTVIGMSTSFPFASVPKQFLGLGQNLDGAYHPGGLAFDNSGTLYISDTLDGVAVDSLLNTVYYTDSQNSRVNMIVRDPTTTYGIVTAVGTPTADTGARVAAQLSLPVGLAVDAMGSLYIAECAANRIRKVSVTGAVTTIAGTGTAGYSGDGGPATDAQLTCPSALAVDAIGNVYVAEPFNGVIRLLRPLPDPALPAVLGAELSAFSSFSPGGESTTGGGALLGGGAAQGNAGEILAQQVRLQISPGAAMTLSHVEIAVLRETGSTTLTGYLMTDDNGPGTIIETFSFRVTAPSGLLAASSTAHPILKGDRPYWFVLAPPDPIHDVFWWYSGSTQLVSPLVAQRIGNTGPWSVQRSWSGYMLRIYAVDAPVSAQPPTITGISNAAGGQPGAVAGSLVSIYGANLAAVPFADWSTAIVNGRLPIQIAGVSVIIGGRSAYIAAVTPTQINVQAPDLFAATFAVTVTAPGGTSAPFVANVQAFAPAFFLWPGNQPAATHPDFTPAAKSGTFQGNTTVAAKPGEIITLWGTGFGPTNPAVPAGYLPTVTAPPAGSPVTVTLSGVPVPVIGAVLSGYPGLYQIAIQIPAATADGDYAVVASVKTVASPSNVLLTVHH